MDTANTVLTFGKHTGKTYDFVRQNDVAYCNWVLKQMNVNNKMLHFQTYLRAQGRMVTCECCNGTGFVYAV